MCNSSYEPILYTVAVYDLTMCIKDDNTCPDELTGDNSRELIRTWGYPV